MPTKSSARWIADGDNMARYFKEKGYQTDLQYAEDDIPNQLAQIENMLTKGVKVLVIAAIDGTTLSDVLAQAASQGTKVIAYDRLIRGRRMSTTTPPSTISRSACSRRLHRRQAGPEGRQRAVQHRAVRRLARRQQRLLLLQRRHVRAAALIDTGKLVVASGQTGMDKVATLRWDGAVAQSRMDNLLSAYYTDKKVDAVLSPYDGLSIGIISSLKGVGYGSGSQKMPIVTGQDAEVPSIKSIIAGEQNSTVFKDTRELAKVTVGMVDAVLSGKVLKSTTPRPTTTASRSFPPTC